jgi:hypothetical protein
MIFLVFGHVITQISLDLISTAIDCCRSSHLSLQLAALRLFHGLSRSVHQLRTTFNDTICDILLDAIKSNDLSIVKISSCVISNIVLEFSTCRTVNFSTKKNLSLISSHSI